MKDRVQEQGLIIARLIKRLDSLKRSQAAMADYLEAMAVLNTMGDMSYHGANQVRKLAGDMGAGYMFLRSRGSDEPPEWFDIRTLIEDISGGLIKVIELPPLFAPIPTISAPTAATDASGGAFTVVKALTTPIPTIAAVAVTASPGAVEGAIADDGGAQTDETTEANSATANDMTLLPATPAVNDASYFGKSTVWDWLAMNIGTAGDGVWTITWEYYNGSSWVALTGVYDTSNGFRNSGYQSVSFVRPGDWATSTVILEGLYWIRPRVSAYTSIVTQPLGTQAWIGVH